MRSGLPAGIYGAMDGGVKRHWDVLEAVPDGRAEGMGLWVRFGVTGE